MSNKTNHLQFVETRSHDSNTLHGSASQLILDNGGVSQRSDPGGGSSQDTDCGSDKLHPDVRPYTMMTRTGYMEFDPMKTLFWRGFCEAALPAEETQLTLIDWIGNTWNQCDFKFQDTTHTTCKISGQWHDICKVHRLAKGMIIKLGVTVCILLPFFPSSLITQIMSNITNIVQAVESLAPADVCKGVAIDVGSSPEYVPHGCSSQGFTTITPFLCAFPVDCFQIIMLDVAGSSMDRENVDAGVGKKRARKVVGESDTSKINQIKHIPDFMHPYIESIIDVKSDCNCGYRVIALADRNNEDDYELIKESMLDELRLHKHDYLEIYGCEKRLAYITDALLPSKRKSRKCGVALIDKWLTFPDMGHIISSILGKVVVKLTKQGASETFFPLRGVPSSDPYSLVICVGAIPGHYVYVKLKDGCPIPPTCVQWKQHCSREAIVWESYFAIQQAKYIKLMDEQIVHSKKSTRVGSSFCDPIDL
ncbi:unnamed protein product [Trifolium pratense]|uniref:Uncharacterized protein n=2 Tax=Trifolium pratense TaxID=57577 RepID=A0ACB0KJ07_TRIPR|nr:unnamed protein product [Trifolium pratense]CAJ2656765.1 unnamed protein product [Trifolium pratense]